jgi:hypothetical protein
MKDNLSTDYLTHIVGLKKPGLIDRLLEEVVTLDSVYKMVYNLSTEHDKVKASLSKQYKDNVIYIESVRTDLTHKYLDGPSEYSKSDTAVSMLVKTVEEIISKFKTDIENAQNSNQLTKATFINLINNSIKKLGLESLNLYKEDDVLAVFNNFVSLCRDRIEALELALEVNKDTPLGIDKDIKLNIEADYIHDRLSIHTISRKYKMSIEEVSRIVKPYSDLVSKIDSRGSTVISNVRNVKALDVGQIEQAIEMRKDGKTYPEIVKLLGLDCVPSTVSRIVRNNGYKNLDRK